MRNIIIVECISTGKNFIEDIINRGYNPIVLELKLQDNKNAKIHQNILYQCYNEIKHDFEIIYEKDSFEETLEMVKKYDPLLILPGGERGVILATKLSYELGLLGNSIENLDAMTLKDEMHNRLAENGLRSIKGKVVCNLDDAIDFYDSENLGEVVIKPVHGGNSTGVRICLNKEELINALEKAFSEFNAFGEKINEILIQERINGEEYIVNTVSSEGVPRVTLVWKYNKVKTSEGAIVYDSCVAINELGIGEAEMVEYAYDVAKAMGIEYGPVHGEYMIDDKGPVLIEVNCRPCGANMSAEYLDKISGQHETDSILDAYLKPKRFNEQLKKRYKLYSYGALKIFIVPEDTMAKSIPVNIMNTNLKSYYASTLTGIEDIKVFTKTDDLDSSGGYVYLVHEDKSVVDDDIDFLRSVEKYAFSLVLSENKPKKADNISLDEIKKLVRESDKYGTGILVSDQKIDGVEVLQVLPSEIGDIDSTFDYIVVNLNESIVENDESNVSMFLDIFSKVKTGGLIFIPKTTYQLMPNERRGMEAVIKALDYKIELPPYYMKEIIIASKEN